MKQNKKNIIIIIIVLVLLLIGLVVYLIDRNSPVDKTLIIASFWDAPNFVEVGDNLNFEDTAIRVKEARSGFEKAMKDYKKDLEIREIQISEQKELRGFATDIASIFTTEDVLMSVGATTNEKTMYGAMEMDFFQIPMLIPYSEGELTVENTDSQMNYVVRLTPTSAKYAEYFSNTLLPASLFDVMNVILFDNYVVPEYSVNIAIFFPDNFSGHNMAVQISQAIMDNNYNVEIYEPYSTDSLSFVVSSAWRDHEDILENIDVVIILGENAAPMPEMKEVYNTWNDRDLKPSFIMLGYRPVDDDPELINASNLYMLIQNLDWSTCPAEITTRSEGLGYAAGYITTKALETALTKVPPEPHGLQLLTKTKAQRNVIHQTYLKNLRSEILSALLNMNENIPCFGKVNLGMDPDERSTLSLVRYKGNNVYEPVSTSVIYDPIIDKIRAEFGLDDNSGSFN